jgi:hypothetical protein
MIDFGPAARSRDEVLAFFDERPRYCAVASVRRDGSPFVGMDLTKVIDLVKEGSMTPTERLARQRDQAR